MAALFVDAHAHLWAEFDPACLLAAALARSRSRRVPVALLLCDTARGGGFSALAEKGSALRLDSLRLRATAEAGSLALGGHGAATSGEVFVIAGRQIVSREGIEVLAHGLDPSSSLAAAGDGALAAAELVEGALDAGAAAVLPWGVGKWLGPRGREVQAVARRFAAHPLFFFGDIAHRAWPWPAPRAFRPPARVLPGTDLLPLPGLERSIASYGFRIEGDFDATRPAASLLQLLRKSAPIHFEGRRAPLPVMLAQQVRLRLRARLRLQARRLA